MFLVEFLPDWQIIAAASPTGPAVDEHALAGEIRQRNRSAIESGEPEIGRQTARMRHVASRRLSWPFKGKDHSLSLRVEPGRRAERVRQRLHRYQGFISIAYDLLQESAALASANDPFTAAGKLFDRDVFATRQRRKRHVSASVPFKRWHCNLLCVAGYRRKDRQSAPQN